jgi:hypothetical protein
MTARFAAFLAVGAVVLAHPESATAEPMDPAIERLVLDTACRDEFGRFTPQNGVDGRATACEADDVAFKKLVSQYAFALAPTAMHSARTTGYGGFHLSIEANYTTIDSDADYWKKGTQGSRDPNTAQASVENASPASVLSVYSLKFRKGFGFGLELTGAVGFMPDTSIVSGGADVRLALLEGFRTGIGGYLPDLAVGGGVRTITGTPQFQLTTVGIDGQLSKPFPIASQSVLTPWIGYQYLFVFGDSGLVDLTPGTNAIQACNYTGNNQPGNPDPNKMTEGSDPDPIFDGSPVCAGGQNDDFNNNAVFSPVRLRRQRLLFGLNYRYEMVMLGAQFVMDIVPPGEAQPDADDKRDLADEDSQYSMVLELGGMF